MLVLKPPQSGSIAGTTASRNRFGQYERSRGIPVQPRSPKATFTRALLSSGSSQWRSLPYVDQTAWNDYADGLTRSNPLGSSYQPTGASLFAGAAVVDTGVGNITVPPSTLPSYLLLVTGMSYTDPTPGPEAFDFTIDATDANNQVLVETSGPISPGITSAAAVRRWRSLPSSANNLHATTYPMTASPIDILTEYKFLFPSPTTGQVIWFRFREAFFDGTVTAGIVNRVRQTFRFVVP